jgi:hypothetical protein
MGCRSDYVGSTSGVPEIAADSLQRPKSAALGQERTCPFSHDRVGKLNAAVVAALADTAVRQKIVAQGFEILPLDQQTPEALAALQKAEIEKWWPIIKAANIRVE